jgi:anti-sigma regulatory factor (Ser/Thr protein kinase)
MGFLPGTSQTGLAHTVALPPTARTAGIARRTTRDVLESYSLGHLAEVAVLLVSEMVGNSVRHALSDGSLLELRIVFAGAVVRIEVLDADPRPPQPRTPGGLDESGFGFVLIEELADDWGVSQTNTGKSVWIELQTSPNAPPTDPRHWSGTRLTPSAF